MQTTKEQLLAAEEAYNRSARMHGFAGAMLIPLEEALDAALALEPSTAPVTLETTTMDRATALVRAKKMVDAASQPVTNARGYADGGWKPPTLEERTTAILRLAAFLTGSAGEI